MAKRAIEETDIRGYSGYMQPPKEEEAKGNNEGKNDKVPEWLSKKHE